jgi:ABC-type siderophore export system fused ATPase/permease subunit
MNIFESINESTTNVVKSGEDYIKYTHAYYKLKIFQLLSLSFSQIIKLALVGVFLFLGLIFLAIAAAIALGNLLGSISLGILIVGLTLILFGLIPYALRKRIDKTILNKFSKSFFD